MKKFKPIYILLLLATFGFASCATTPETTTTTTTTVEKTPMNRNDSNGLASYMH
jgi:hypothetical protein